MPAGDTTVKKIWPFFPLIIVPGIVLLLAPSTVKSIMESFNFRESLGGLLQVAYFAGGTAGILLITHLMQRWTARQIILSQVLLLSLSLAAAAISPWYPMLLFFYLVAGFANGILITYPGVYATRVCGDESHRAQNLIYGFFALGVVTSPLLAKLLIDNLHSWRWALAAPAILILPLSIPVALRRLERIEGVEKLSSGVLREIFAFNRKLFTGLLFALLFYIAAESAVSLWLITFLEKEYDVSPGTAHLTLTALWIGITVGRWIVSSLVKKADPYKIIVFLTIISGFVVLAAPLTGSKTASMILYMLVGLFYSGIYPTLIGYVAWFPEDIASSVFTLFLAAGALGGAVLPYLVGLLNQFAGRVAGMSSIAVMVFGVLVCLFWLKGQLLGRNTANRET
ncbi:MAG: MFS transporter [Actinobacteria bacterium]|nr:MFS transporter [Actinomycetota bacterium]